MPGRVVVDRDVCVGAGMCVVYAPDTFAHDDEAKAVVVGLGQDPADAVDAAVDACPTGALRRAEDETRV